MRLKSMVFWSAMPCSFGECLLLSPYLAEADQCCHLFQPGGTVSSKMLNTLGTTKHCIPEGCTLMINISQNIVKEAESGK
jgi:hypothetical protein